MANRSLARPRVRRRLLKESNFVSLRWKLILFLLIGMAPAFARAESWSTNLACFKGGLYDGWDMFTMNAYSTLGGAVVTLASESDQFFVWNQQTPVPLEPIAIETEDPKDAFKAGTRVTLLMPAKWLSRFDQSSTLSFSGDAAHKIGACSFSGDGRALHINIISDFAAHDALVLSGLRLIDLHLAPHGSARLGLDFDDDGTADAHDACVLDVSVCWDGGSYDGWNSRAAAEYELLLRPPMSILTSY